MSWFGRMIWIQIHMEHNFGGDNLQDMILIWVHRVLIEEQVYIVSLSMVMIMAKHLVMQIRGVVVEWDTQVDQCFITGGTNNLALVARVVGYSNNILIHKDKHKDKLERINNSKVHSIRS